MKKTIAAVTVLAAAAAASAQESPPAGDAPKTALADAIAPLLSSQGEITVTATRTRRDTFEVPQAVSVFERSTVQDVGSFVAMRTPSRRHPAIWYDERSSTTTDLIIRGFAGFNLLTLVDGNTLSTLWGEGGFGADDMYGKIDPEIVERIEVLRGPGSVLYGSNALGAVVNVITRVSPLDFTDEGWEWGGRVKLSATTNFGADGGESVGSRTEFYGADPRVRFLVGGSARNFDHVNGGGDLGVLAPSDGRERNWDFSGEYMFDEGRYLRVTVQDVHRDHVKRFYRPFQDNESDREAIALNFRDEVGNDVWDRIEARFYWQEKVDRRRFFNQAPGGGTGSLDRIGVATTKTLQGSLQATRDLGRGHVLTAGFQAELDRGDSPDDEQFTFVFPGPKRRDAPLSKWWDYGVFVQDEWRIDKKWSVIGSARYDRMVFATEVDSAYQPPLGNPDDDEFRTSVGSVTGGLGGVYRATEELHLVANWGRGFRQSAPNFGLRQLGDGVLIPNQLLDPTTSDNFEVGVKGRYPGASFEGFVYKSFIDNWQGDFRTTTFSGRSFLDADGDGVKDANEGFVQQVEGGKAAVYGVELTAKLHPLTLFSADIPPQWSLWGGLARNVGRVDGTSSHPQEEPLRHTQPTRGLLGVRWDDLDHPQRGLYVELVADMVNSYHDIPSDRRLTDLAWRTNPQDGSSPLLRSWVGTPGYTLFNLYAGFNISDDATLRFGIENVFDKKYRAAHSRMDGSGFSATASLEIRF